MTLVGLAVVLAVGLVGPLLATPARLRLPVVVGEMVLGVVVGRTGFGWVHPDDQVLSFLATVGFALVMLVAGSHVPVRNATLRSQLGRGLLLAARVGVLAVPIGLLISGVAGTGHGLLYAVLLASSSAALVMPVIDGAALTGSRVTATVVQVAAADTVCIVALPLAENPSKALGAAAGALAVIAAGAVVAGVMTVIARTGTLRRLQQLSKRRHFGLELRWNLIILFSLAGLAQAVGVSVMLAGFVSGIVLASLGEPRRLAKQLFSVSDGFLAPVFFVWLGASLDLRAIGGHPKMLLVAGLLALGTAGVHAAVVLAGQPLPLALLAGAQLGVPVAAVTIGTNTGRLAPGEGGAILAAALVSIAVTSVASAFAARPPRGPGPASPASEG
ncbi:Kef-type K+ transport system, membrane component KefB [Nakamurella panacisegetis]|uniref:Kef-type K+ transport system, membrane component KefB n=1 Tax=Nakamurella panacisegetis TaxID=1090615 RepID=A0A1H0RQK8_9ACTN|nr:cation:proton antiporter [Nakamurella panacisegetis]SDP31256.1 Kef-type K+ transport system, membrane component KefB [Nakamurella panacisegetis]